jgi:hypothetical protein
VLGLSLSLYNTVLLHPTLLRHPAPPLFFPLATAIITCVPLFSACAIDRIYLFAPAWLFTLQRIYTLTPRSLIFRWALTVR